MTTKQSKVGCLRLAAVLATCAVSVSRADFWGPEQSEHWSKNRRYVLQVVSSSDELRLVRTRAMGIRQELWSRPYVDKTGPPRMAYVADDGKHVILRDVHTNLGFGRVLVFLGAKGETIRSYALADLLTEAQIFETKHTVSSIWWSEPGWFSFLKGDREFAFVTTHETTQCFNVASGERVELDDKVRSEIHRLATIEVAAMLGDKDSAKRMAAAQLCGPLKAVQLVPKLKSLISDRTVTSSQGYDSEQMWDYYGVQVAAAGALAALIRKEAAPLIEPQLSNSTRAVGRDLLGIIADLDGGLDDFRRTPDSDYLLATWHRLMQSEHQYVREYATQAVVVREKPEYIYDHPALVEHPNDQVRYQTVCSLVERGDARAISLLRKALQDSYSPTQSWAFSGLIKYKPDDILDVLRNGMANGDPNIQMRAMAELVRRGDKDALGEFAKRLARLKDHTHTREGWGSEEMAAGGRESFKCCG